ncbi:MAG: hypothetical protein IJT96_04715 [Lachnospiraceae bacterium]|nr:hypothetical protein [Lachnospiraceae bacterium]
MSDKLIKIANFNTNLNSLLNLNFPKFDIYRSKGLLAHLINKKHFKAAKYIDYLPEIIMYPDYAGCNDGNIELVKMFKDNIFISIKLDNIHKHYYVATMFEVKMGKIEAYVKTGRLKMVVIDSNPLTSDKNNGSL